MRIRKPHTELDEHSERALEEKIRAASDPEVNGPQDPFWQNLLVRTNARIDDVASGKGITISWAARVAIPGVVAILAFLVGLHYYIPELTAKRDQLTDILSVLPDATQDSLLERYSIGPETLSAVIAEDVFNVPVAQAQDYYLENSDLSQLSELLSDEEVSTVLTMLESSTITTPEPTQVGGS